MIKFKVIARYSDESERDYEKRLEKSFNSFFSGIDTEKGKWNFSLFTGTGTDTEPGTETFIAWKEITDKKQKVGF